MTSEWLSRRDFAARVAKFGAVLGTVGLSASGVLFPQDSASRPEEGPLVTSFDLSLVNDWLTPSELFFIREHFPAPRFAGGDFTVTIAGAVARELEISYRELLRRPRVDLPAVLECAGNPVGGGMLGNAEWSGTRLGPLLKEAGPLPEAKFVRLMGADGDSAGAAQYSRSIPLEKALHGDTLLAYGMNGETLTRHHGFPVRAVVPGWYGMDSVKWLRRIEVLTEPDRSPVMTGRYLREARQSDGSVSTEPVTAMEVKSAFARPLNGAVLYGRRFPVRGIAWAGENRVHMVEVSTDGGASWNNVEVSGARRYSWVRWRYDWNIPGPGTFELIVRAADDAGRTQPAVRPAGRQDAHELNHYDRVKCRVV